MKVPTDVLLSAVLRKKNEIFSISEFKKELSDMCELANQAINTRQIKLLTYHDWTVSNDVIK